MIKTASVIVYKDQVYIPTQGLVKEGPFYISLDPIRITKLTESSLTKEIQFSYTEGNPLTEIESYKDYHKHDPVLKATNARSWKQLAQQGVSYGVTWHIDKVILYIPKLDKKGRFVNDPEKQHQFPSDVDTKVIASVILEDYSSRDFD